MKYSVERVRETTKNREPNFNNLLDIFSGRKPERPTLFEFYLNNDLEEELAGRKECTDFDDYLARKIEAFRVAGYDYVTISTSGFYFTADTKIDGKETKSLNDGHIITDWESFEKYEWADPVDSYDGLVERIAGKLPEGMKFNVSGPNGVLENVIGLVGYDNLCFMIADEPELVEAIFDEVGSRLVSYYKHALSIDSVGMIISNDDWGFNTQTLLSVADMKKYVFPWHQKIIEAAHSVGKPVVIHSCGCMDQIIDLFGADGELPFDGKHSYEDNIKPVEQAYEEYKSRFAVMGGIDLDFLVRKTPDEVYKRACDLIEQTNGCVRFGMGSGNSIPPYVPNENYYAMILAAVEK